MAAVSKIEIMRFIFQSSELFNCLSLFFAAFFSARSGIPLFGFFVSDVLTFQFYICHLFKSNIFCASLAAV